MVNNEYPVQIIPLGGFGEIGKNMTVVRYQDEIMVIDSGLAFPEDEMLGIDIVIPDITYLTENRSMIKGIVLTHGHEDHIGALPYVLKEINAPVYGTKLTLGLLQEKLKENRISDASLNVIRPRSVVKLGSAFSVEFLRVTHSVPDSVGMVITTPVGIILHTGDFKIDQTPVDGEFMDFGRIAEIGKKGVLVMLSDSTNVERQGFTPSETEVGYALRTVFGNCRDRIILATFASNVHRIQQVVDASVQYDRKVAVVGRSMVNVISIAQELGYMNIPPDTLIDIDEIGRYPKHRITILTTGSQGEPMSALSRMAASDHRKVEIMPGDTVVISATPIPGNEKTVAKTINQLYRQGAEVLYDRAMGIHTSGHANQEELKLMLNLVKPKFFLPAHGEYRHLIKHAQLAYKMGVPMENIFVGENGQILEFTSERGTVCGRVPSGRVLIDGLGVGDVGNIVLRDRKQLSQDGIVVVVMAMRREGPLLVSGPEIISRGFVYVRESDELMEVTRDRVRSVLDKCAEKRITDWPGIKSQVRDALGRFLYEKTRRRPMIMPIIMEM
ncbi:MAG: ribonuclease J [Peptococcaceae bacterium]|jgi:ribonuclease J|nr:ribonuclease J [Peptococcaceae bacterium]